MCYTVFTKTEYFIGRVVQQLFTAKSVKKQLKLQAKSVLNISCVHIFYCLFLSGQFQDVLVKVHHSLYFFAILLSVYNLLYGSRVLHTLYSVPPWSSSVSTQAARFTRIP